MATHDEHESVSRKLRKLQAFENWGAEVLVFSADVANHEHMQTVITQAKKQFGSINGVIHTAGIADYAGVIHKRTRETTENILAPKVRGTLILDHLLKEFELDFFVLCSSLGSVVYQVKFGQVGYSAANEFLDAFAYYKTSQDGTFTVAINWTDWQGVGMALEAEKHWAKTYGQSIFSDSLLPTEGVEVLKRILNYTFSRVVISTQELRRVIEQASASMEIAFPKNSEANLSKYAHPRPEISHAYVAPRHETEQTLSEVWQTFFGLEKVGIHDDFFELGGDSLLAVQLTSKLRKTFQTHLSSHSLLDSPSIAALAELIDKKTSGSATHIETQALSSLLVQLQRGTPSKRPLFLIHPVGGSVFYYRDLVHCLNSEQPVYGIQARGVEGETELFTRLEDMASHYIKVVRDVQPEGPYLLGGASLGGVVAFEMAQRFHALDQEVALLAVIDIPNLEQMPLKHEQDWETRALAHMMDDGANFFGILKQLRSLEPDEQMRYFLQKGKESKILSSDFELVDVHRFVRLFKTNFQALWNYVPKIYPGRLVFFSAEERDKYNPENPELGWADKAAGGMVVHKVPGNHFTMLFHPNVEVIAELLAAYLDKV